MHTKKRKEKRMEFITMKRSRNGKGKIKIKIEPTNIVRDSPIKDFKSRVQCHISLGLFGVNSN